jgi:hypothetical protein
MRKTKEVLRLRFELGLGQRAIARACSISQGAVHNYLKKAAAAGIHWPLPEGWDEKRIEEALLGDRHPVEQRPRVPAARIGPAAGSRGTSTGGTEARAPQGRIQATIGGGVLPRPSSHPAQSRGMDPTPTGQPTWNQPAQRDSV